MEHRLELPPTVALLIITCSQWIGETGTGASAGNLLRKEFELPLGTQVLQAYAYINGLGYDGPRGVLVSSPCLVTTRWT